MTTIIDEPRRGADRTAPARRARRNLASVAVATAALALGVGMLEAGVRLLWGPPPVWLTPQVEHVETEYGYKLAPSRRSYTADKPVTTNSAGFRDREWVLAKPAGRLRVMMLGDSLTFGNLVRIEDTFARRLEERLKRIDRNTEVMIAAAGGWNTFRQLDFLRLEGMTYQPDLVVLAFFPNDFAVRGAKTPHLKLTKRGRLDERPGWLNWLDYDAIFLLKRSALISFLRIRLNNFLSDEAKQEAGYSFTNGLVAGTVDLDAEERVGATYGYLAEMRALLARNGTDLVIAHLPTINLFWADKAPPYVDHLRAFARDNDIPFVDLAEGFRTAGATNRFYLYPWDNHFSPLGHAEAADQILQPVSRWIERRRKSGAREN